MGDGLLEKKPEVKKTLIDFLCDMEEKNMVICYIELLVMYSSILSLTMTLKFGNHVRYSGEIIIMFLVVILRTDRCQW